MLVRIFPRHTLIILLIAALTLAACNMGATPAPTLDVNAINTAAVATAMGQISAQLTETALAAPSETPLPSQPSETPIPLTSFVLPTTAVAGSPVPGGGLPTVSFNSTPIPNNTPLAGFTPIGSPVPPVATQSLGDACNNNVFVADVTIPDGTIFQDNNPKGGRPGSEFQKVWRVQNTGSCKWDEGYVLAFVGGDAALEPHSVKFDSSSDFVDPGATVDLSVSLVAPKFPGKYAATWRMQSDNGSFFGTLLTVQIEVIE